MPAMPRTRDVAADLADRMVQALAGYRSQGGGVYPLTLKRLAEGVDPQATRAEVLKAAAKRSFLARVVLARSKDCEAPVAFKEDLELLAGHPAVLEYLLRCSCTPSNQALSAAQLKAKASTQLKKLFQQAVSQQLEDGSLPPAAGWIAVNRSKRLFLWEELHRNQGSGARSQESEVRNQESGATAQEIASPSLIPDSCLLTPEPADFARAFDEAFARLDRQGGGHNFVNLVDLRRELPWDRATFDAELHNLRRLGRYGLSAAEGRHGVSPEEQQAGIREGGALLLFVAKKTP
jgi:hypothetical protein